MTFDFFDYHNFNVIQNYEAGTCGKNLDFFKKMLAEVGFADKPVLIIGRRHALWLGSRGEEPTSPPKTDGGRASGISYKIRPRRGRWQSLDYFGGTVVETEFPQPQA